ncbi:MAG: Guanosine-5'-triphosphate,3'-diphosphate pyrophosphatase [Arcobacter lacus]|nr:MAG: Guanosine-5'-triphosphate,3'-diphosphate pyrophosphatase [Arcobacter lacus]
MAKITTIIDIGSNSMRMVVLKKSSRFSFSLINESKARVKISEGCYENGGNLQEIPMQRAYESMKSFLNISNNLKSRKIICVATSALRDAPNAKTFLTRIKNDFGISIKVIDGEKEAYYGGVAALNLIHENSFVTVDIGGGSTEFSFVNEGKIIKSISLNIGTVRIKELYFNKNDFDGARKYILNNLEKIYDLNISIPNTAVGIGGSIRAISKAIMKNDEYPLDVLHGFKYDVENQSKYLSDIIESNSDSELSNLNIKKDRFDTIKEGTFIFKTILDELNIKKVITSGAGVREGVYLDDLLRNSNGVFPANFNVSVRNLLDRFEIDSNQSSYFGNNARKIFDALKPLHKLDDEYRTKLVIASKLHSIGNTLNFYKSNDNAFDFIINGLSYDFSHKDRLIIAHIIKFSKKSLPKEKNLGIYEDLLPCINTMKWLSFMISLNLATNEDFSRPKITYELDENNLKIDLVNKSFFIKSNIDKLELPKQLNLNIL